MNSFIAAFLLWAVTAYAIKDKHLEKTDRNGFQNCKDTLNLSVLEVLPGGGWDNLRNVDMGRVVDLTYTHCRTTEDGQYIIPNEVFTIPRKQSNLEMNSEILESWLDYQSSTSHSINTEISLYSKVNGKFSTEFQRMKTNQVKDHAITTRVQVRDVTYTVKTHPNSELSFGFKQDLLEICDYLENNQTKLATYLAELLVLNYGTHVITSVDAGAVLLQEDHIRSSVLKDSKTNRNAVTASAGFSFLEKVSFQMGTEHKIENSETKSYLSNLTNSRIQSIGGIPFYPGISFQTWQDGIANHLVAVDRSGLPLHFFIKPDKLPGLPVSLVQSLSETVEKAVKSYYFYNTYPGCTDVDSPNFNFQANVDDGSCGGKVTDFLFGGIYQQCTQLFGYYICDKFEQKNPLTGDFSCPSGSSPVLLLSQTHEEGRKSPVCKRKCGFLGFNCKRVCEDVFSVSKVEFKAFWCVANGQPFNDSGLLFGGLFSSQNTNPLTNEQSCPVSYISLRFFKDLTVCVSMDREQGFKFSVPFGGFFSCKTGNPLTGSSTSVDLKAPALKKCPGGFSQQLAIISDGCQVSYCVKAGAYTRGTLHPPRLPPFTNPPVTSEEDKSDSSKSWLKEFQTQQLSAGMPQELQSGHASVGSTVGITVVVILGLAIVITLGVLGTQKYKKLYQGNPFKKNFSFRFWRSGATSDKQSLSPA